VIEIGIWKDMKEKILKHLVCPSCGEGLSLESFKKENSEIKDGLLICECQQWFPIIDFIPRLLLKNYRGNYRNFLKKHNLNHLKENAKYRFYANSSNKQVQESFASKWMSQPTWGIDGETAAFMREWILDKYGWRDREGFKKALGSKRKILDAGTGLGRVVANFCEVNKQGEVFGVDLSDAVEAAYQNTKQYPNAHVIQGDLTNLPFRAGFFDFIFSEGVLHHTRDTHKAFEVLSEFLAPKGEIAIYIYKKKGPIREFCDDYLRQSTIRLSDKECWDFSKRMTAFGKALSDLQIEFEVPENIPELGIKAGKYDMQRFFYSHVFKCFWNDRFSFDENNLINFDWYHPAYAYHHTPEEVKRWFQKADLQLVHLDVSESGIAARGLKP
jgi:arsenite methyltransferase